MLDETRQVFLYQECMKCYMNHEVWDMCMSIDDVMIETVVWSRDGRGQVVAEKKRV